MQPKGPQTETNGELSSIRLSMMIIVVRYEMKPKQSNPSSITHNDVVFSEHVRICGLPSPTLSYISYVYMSSALTWITTPPETNQKVILYNRHAQTPREMITLEQYKWAETNIHIHIHSIYTAMSRVQQNYPILTRTYIINKALCVDKLSRNWVLKYMHKDENHIRNRSRC